jgi:ElaB/YqjD/DUF883 family membrane-anchored ribosome-binding protein
MDWIFENVAWIGPSIFAGISTVWTYLTTKKNRLLSEKLQKADVQIRESESKIKELNVDSAGIDVRTQEASLQQQMIDYSARAFAQFEELSNKKIEKLQENFELEIQKVRSKHDELDHLYEQAKQAISTHEVYIANLQKYTLYLQGLLKNNNIEYKEQHEI